MFAGVIERAGASPPPLSWDLLGQHAAVAATAELGGLRLASLQLAELPGARTQLERHPDLPVHIAWYGQLYNRKELLGSLPGATAEASAASLVLAGYHAWGSGLLDRLVGDFSFALWDEPQQTLLAALDPFGTRSFCYALAGERLVFASHPGLVRDLLPERAQPDRHMIVRFLSNRWGRADQTFYAPIKQLPGGHVLRYEAGRLHIERYWLPGRPPLEQRGPEEVLEEFAAQCRRAVAERLPGDAPASLVMSGGVDSTSIAGLVADLRSEGSWPPFLVIAGEFPGLPCDETPFIEAMLAHTGLPARRVPDLAQRTSVAELCREIRRHGAPFLNPQGPLFAAFMAESRAFGARTVLSGLGGDELTVDFGYLKDLFVHFHWRRLASGVRAMLERYPRWPTCLHLARELCPEPLKIPYRWLRGLRPRRPLPLPGWLTPEARQLADDSEAAAAKPRFACHTLDEAWQYLTAPGTQAAFTHWVNEFAAGGLEARAPFLDRRLFELVFRLPFSARPFCDAEAPFKPLFTRGLARNLPTAIRRRDDKASLDAYGSLVFHRGLDELTDYLFTGDWRAEEFVSRQAARSLFEHCHFDETENRRDPHGVSRGLQPLRQIAALELWLRDLAAAGLPQHK